MKFETIYISKPDLTDKEQEDLLQEVKNKVQEIGGFIASEEVWGKRKLAYPIQKQSLGYYVLLNVEDTNEDFAKELARFYDTKKNIMKHIIVNMQ